MVRRLRWRKTVDRALLGPSTRALECDSLLPLSFGGSLLPAAPRASSKHKSGSPSVDGPHSKALRADTCWHHARRRPVGASPRASQMARKAPLTNYAQYSRLFNGAGRFCHALENSRMTPHRFLLKRHNVAVSPLLRRRNNFKIDRTKRECYRKQSTSLFGIVAKRECT